MHGQDEEEVTAQRRLRDLARAGGGRFWRGIEELLEDPAARRWLGREFPDLLVNRLSRRDLLKAMAAPLVMAGLAGCGPAESPALPYVHQPEGVTPGAPRLFATAVPFEGYAQPVLAECRQGRPIRLDGNPLHPMSRGSIDAFTQAALMGLYDPDRSAAVIWRGRITPWTVFDGAMLSETARLKATGGAGLRLLTAPTSSPTFLAQLAALRRAFPGLRWHGWSPAATDGRAAAARLAFGRPLLVWPRLDQARVVVSLEDDLLGAGPLQVPQARAWAHQRASGEGWPLLFVAESTPSLTGAQAHNRLAADPSRLPALLAAIGGEGNGENEAERSWLAALRHAMALHPGAVLVTAGTHLPADMQAEALRLSHRLGRAGVTLSFSNPVVAEPDGGLADLAAEMRDGRVETLLMIGVNPVYDAPGDLDIAEALGKVPLTVHLGEGRDETAALSQWHLPLAHPLESWGDARAVDGTVTILQPLIEPLRQGRTAPQLLAGLLGRPGIEARQLTRETWADRLDEAAWRRALQDGLIADSFFRPVTVTPSPASPPLVPSPAAPPEEGAVEIVFRPDPTVWDGRFADIGWLQELPKPLTKLVWGNAVGVSLDLANRLSCRDGDRVEIELAGRKLQGPALILPGQAAGTVTLTLGYGRTAAGRVGQGLGHRTAHLRPPAYPPGLRGRLRKGKGREPLVTTQMHNAIDGNGLVRVVEPLQGTEDAAETLPGHPRLPSLYPRRPVAGDARGEAWGMVIDLDLCIGCNACVIACQAENNIPVVGREQVALGREMHWLRIDRYYEGPVAALRTHFQPVPCMHCENAPCELGCPVNATVHGPDGVNEMVYNRCIGTRTCASYCPYKVRRFNYFDFAATTLPLPAAQRNPEVSVRARGVMEKCTYCIQRIATARDRADGENRPLRDGEVRTACQNACPTRTIVFGNLADPAADVSRTRDDRRNYGLLDELNTWPRTTYLARIRRHGPAGEA